MSNLTDSKLTVYDGRNSTCRGASWLNLEGLYWFVRSAAVYSGFPRFEQTPQSVVRGSAPEFTGEEPEKFQKLRLHALRAGLFSLNINAMLSGGSIARTIVGMDTMSTSQRNRSLLEGTETLCGVEGLRTTLTGTYTKKVSGTRSLTTPMCCSIDWSWKTFSERLIRSLSSWSSSTRNYTSAQTMWFTTKTWTGRIMTRLTSRYLPMLNT